MMRCFQARSSFVLTEASTRDGRDWVALLAVVENWF